MLEGSNRISWKVFLRAVLTIALPIALQNLLATTASMVDTIMIGSEGELAVAAVGICSQISSLFFSCYIGFAGGAILFFAQYWHLHKTLTNTIHAPKKVYFCILLIQTKKYIFRNVLLKHLDKNTQDSIL